MAIEPTPWSGNLQVELMVQVLHFALDPAAPTTPDEAKSLRQLFLNLTLVNRSLLQLVLRHVSTVLLCSLRLVPRPDPQALNAWPIGLVIEAQIDTASTQRRIPLLALVQALVQATDRIPDDETACQTLLALGVELLKVALRRQLSDAQRQDLMAVPQCIFHALRMRMQRSTKASAPVASALRSCFKWVQQEGGSAAIPWLAELYFTVGQADRHHQDAWLDPIMLYPGTVIDALGRANQQVAGPLVDGIDLLIELMPNPWNLSLPPAPSPADISRALHFLATYPYPPLGFVPEVLDHLQTLALDEQQQALLQTCRDKLSSHGLPPTATQWH